MKELAEFTIRLEKYRYTLSITTNWIIFGSISTSILCIATAMILLDGVVNMVLDIPYICLISIFIAFTAGILTMRLVKYDYKPKDFDEIRV